MSSMGIRLGTMRSLSLMATSFALTAVGTGCPLDKVQGIRAPLAPLKAGGPRNPRATATPAPSPTPVPTAAPRGTPTPTPRATAAPTAAPTGTPRATPSPTPRATPTPTPAAGVSAGRAVLQNRCFYCHDGSRAGIPGFAFATDEAFVTNGYINTSNPAGSRLLVRVKFNSTAPAANMPYPDPMNANPERAFPSFTQAEYQTLLAWAQGLATQTVTLKPFSVAMSSFSILNIDIRMDKLRAVFGADLDPFVSGINALASLLGAYDYANAMPPELSWSQTRIQKWMEAVEPLCTSSAVANRYKGTAGRLDFLQKAYGRAPAAEDNAVLSNLTGNASLTDQERFSILCLTLLSSAEFVSL